MANEKRLIDAHEVKKSLSMCYKQGLSSECAECQYRAYKGVCMDALMEDALALINQLEAKMDDTAVAYNLSPTEIDFDYGAED